MDKFDKEVIPNMTEQCVVSFHTTGSKGGDAGHGGNACFSVFGNGSSYPGIQVDMTLKDGGTVSYYDKIEGVIITVQGDWELEGLAGALMEIGTSLAARKDVMYDFARWNR